MQKPSRATSYGLIMFLLTTGVLAYSLKGTTRTFYLPGPTTSGHYQIELACDGCHTSAFTDQAELQAACVRCHGEELEQAHDSHPLKKFTDPRNAELLTHLDARLCVTCHREHRPELVSAMGLSLPEDYCYRCHQGIAEERPSHAGLSFASCADPGCHNFHDNRGLYEDYLLRSLEEQPLGTTPKRRTPAKGNELGWADADAPPHVRLAETEQRGWLASAHAAAGVNCSGCHGGGSAGSFSERVDDARCADCHAEEHQGYLRGRHGMRQAAGLGPLKVADARAPMLPSAHAKTLSCTACHGAHRFDTRAAAADACLGCHADEHSRSYPATPHAALFRADETGASGASCATCHLPRQLAADGSVTVEHNQNATLRPNEKLVRSVCTRCHEAAFSLAALADADLVLRNFDRAPSKQHPSIEMIRARAREN